MYTIDEKYLIFLQCINLNMLFVKTNKKYIKIAYLID